jgi:tripartite-type tricarboxylate transporter receptor subunit TctC
MPPITRASHSLKRLALALAASLLACAALAQGYPAKPVRIVVPFGPGGAVDTVSRIVGQRLSEQMKTPFIVENRAGASGNLGAEAVARAAPDGYTLLMGANGLATNGALFGSLPFDTLRDFKAVARIGYAPLVLVVPASSPAKSLRELVATAKAQPGKLSYGTAGNGSSGHLASELLRSTAGIDVFHVPYKGGAPALADLVGERLSFMLINPVEAVPHVRANRLRALAVSSDKRLALLADVPTFAEAGLPGYEASVWWGLVAPARAPRDVVQRLSDETLRALQDEGVRQKLEALGAVVAPQPAEEFGRFLAREIRTWEAVIRKSGIRAD